jgi:hypothetical protein
MTDTLRDADSLLFGNSITSAKFASHGDKIAGHLVGKDTQHKAKFNPQNPSDKSELMYFKSGDPVLELILDLQTDERDPEVENDNGVRRVYVPFQMQQALQQAVKEAGIKKSLPLGSHIEITHTHSVPSKGGGSPRKEYKVVVTGPADKIATGTAPATAVNNDGPVLSEQTKELMRQAGIPIPGEA